MALPMGPMGGGDGNRPVVVVLTGREERFPPGLDPLRQIADVRPVAGEGLVEAIPDAEVLLVTDFRTTALREAWPRAERLRWIHATSAGVDAVLLPEVVASDVVVTNARGVFDRPLAETVLAMILVFAKDVHGSLAYQRERRWKHRDTERIEGRRVLVVGAGPIGREIGRLCRAAGMEVSGLARRSRQDDPDLGTVHAATDLRDVLPAADYVVLVAPLTKETRGMFGPEEFRAMNRSARFINVGRGPLVQTDALVGALERGEIAGAALDVFEEEPLPPDHPLWGFRQVVITAHMAGDFVGWREALSEQFLDNFRRWLRGEPLRNQVDKRRGYVPVGEG